MKWNFIAIKFWFHGNCYHRFRQLHVCHPRTTYMKYTEVNRAANMQMEVTTTRICRLQCCMVHHEWNQPWFISMYYHKFQSTHAEMHFMMLVSTWSQAKTETWSWETKIKTTSNWSQDLQHWYLWRNPPSLPANFCHWNLGHKLNTHLRTI